jgi:hypothetical protein
MMLAIARDADLEGVCGEDPDRPSRAPRLRKERRRPPPDPRRDGCRRRHRTCRQVETLADDEDNARTASTESSTTTDVEAVNAVPHTRARLEIFVRASDWRDSHLE